MAAAKPATPKRLRVGCAGARQFALLDQECAISEANRFLEAIELRGLSRWTVRSYAYDLLLFYRWLLESDRKLHQLTAADLLQFVASQRQGDAAPRSINRRLSTIRLLYRFHRQGHSLQGFGHRRSHAVLRPSHLRNHPPRNERRGVR